MQEHVWHINIGPLLREAVLMLTAEKRHQALLDKSLRAADEYVTANEPQIRQRTREKTAWLWQRLSMDDKVADSVVAVLREVLAEIGREPAHPLRLKLDKAIEKLAVDLATSSEYREQIEANVRKLLNRRTATLCGRYMARNSQEAARVCPWHGLGDPKLAA